MFYGFAFGRIASRGLSPTPGKYRAAGRRKSTGQWGLPAVRFPRRMDPLESRLPWLSWKNSRATGSSKASGQAGATLHQRNPERDLEVSMKSLCSVLSAAMFLLGSWPAAWAQDPNPNPGVYLPHSIVSGKSVGDWTAVFWQWGMGIPPDRHPFLDNDGGLCHLGQRGPVFLLTGSPPGHPPLEKTCTIPCGKAILIPLMTSMFWAPGDCDRSNMDECRRKAKEDMDRVDLLQCTLDGREIVNLEEYREVSPVFQFAVPTENLGQLDPGILYRGVSDGFWLMFEPFPEGEHLLSMKAGWGNTILEV